MTTTVHNVSIQEIAAEAEFATGTIYNFFESKEALYWEIMDEVADNVVSLISPIFESQVDEREKCASFIGASVRVFRENAARIRLFFRANQSSPVHVGTPQFNETANDLHQTVQSMLRQIFRSGVHKGLFRPLDPQVVGLALEAALRAIVFSAAEGADDDTLERRVADVEELFFRGILNEA